MNQLCENTIIFLRLLGGKSAYQLQMVSLQLVDSEKCSASYASDESLPEGIMDEGQLCAGDPLGRMDTCQVRVVHRIFHNISKQKMFLNCLFFSG